MRRPLALSIALSLSVISSATLAGQVSSPNRSGVAMGHVHFIVRDLDANRRFWSSLGGVPIKKGSLEGFKFPGLLILLTRGTPVGNGTGEVVDHVAFRTRNLDETMAAVKAAGFKVEPPAEIPNTARAYTPDGYKIELFDSDSESPRFFPEASDRDSDVDRHMVTMTVPIVSQHIHYYLPDGADRDVKAWYFKLFGGTPGRRLRYEAVDLPGMNLNFSISSVANAPKATPTKGRTLDHIGFEIRGLAAFCKKLEASGVKFDTPFAKGPEGVGTAFITDPWGTTIELTEGLSGL